MTHRPLCFTLVAALLIVITLTAATPLYVSACPVEEAPEIPNEMANPYPVEPFASIFTLTADWRVGAAWDSTDWVDFQTRILDADSTNTADRFPLVWDYFASTDQNPAYGAINLNGVTKIPLHLYFCPGCANFTVGNSIYLQAANPDSTISSPSTVVGTSRSFTHELCHAIISMTGGASSWLNEGLATASEYVSGSRWEELATSPYNTEYDRSLQSYGTNLDPPNLGLMDKLVTYNLWSTFNAYLMAHFGGPDSGREDDLLYNWLRPHSDGGFTYQLYGLAVALDSLSTVAPTAYPVGSGTKSEKLGRLFHRSVMARYADEDSSFEGRYGLGADVSARSFRLFQFVDTGAIPTRVLPPMFVVGQPEIVPNGQGDVSDFLCTRGSLPEACRLRDLGLHSWGAEYLIFRADSAYVAQGIDRTLHVELKTERALQTSERVRVGYLAYASADSVLYDKPLVSVLEEAPITVSGEGATASIEIPEFGGAVQGVVVVVSLVPDPIPASESNFTDNYCSPPTCPDCSYTGREPTLKIQVSYELENLTIPVPSAAVSELQEGIDKASAGDTLLVGQSDGFGPITVDKALAILPGTSGKQLVRASNGAAATITAGHVEGLRFVGSSASQPVVLFSGSTATLASCEIVGGSGSTAGIQGNLPGGVLSEIAVTMDSCGTSTKGVYLTYGDTEIDHCTVEMNSGYGFFLQGMIGDLTDCRVTMESGVGLFENGLNGTMERDTVTVASTGVGMMVIGGSGSIKHCIVDVADSVGVDLGSGYVAMDSCEVTIGHGTGILLVGPDEVTHTTVTVTGGQPEDYGVVLDVNSPTLADCFITAPGALGGTGIDVRSGNAIVEGCTVYDVAYGVLNGGGGTVRGCLVSEWTMIGFAGAPVTYCIADGEGGYYGQGTQGTGSVNEDPLLCDPTSGEFTLRVDSYGNPENNDFGQIGAFPVACMYGTLARDSKYAGDGTLSLPGDLTIPDGKRLNLGSGTSLDIAKSDSEEGGANSGLVELIVSGRLEVDGTPESRVTFESVGPSHAESDWYGIRCESSAKVFLRSFELRHTYRGLSLGNADSAVVKCGVLGDNESWDIALGPSSGDMALIDSCDVTIGAGYGIQMSNGGSTATVSNCTLTGNGSSSGGITTLMASGSSTITGNTIQGLLNGPALNITSGTPVVTKNTLTGCKYGIYTSTGSYTIGDAADTTKHNTITGHSTAGILADGASATPAILTNNISSNTFGVTIKSNANPVLGDANQDGNNKFLSNSTYCIWNRNTSGTVSARGNYFGDCGGGGFPVACWNGSVDVNDYLCAPPFSKMGTNVKMGLIGPASLMSLRVTPNPTTGQAAVSIELDGSAQAGVQVFDVAGRLVREFPRMPLEIGENLVRWDGKTADGRTAPAGIYFFRVTTDDRLTRTARILVVR